MVGKKQNTSYLKLALVCLASIVLIQAAFLTALWQESRSIRDTLSGHVAGPGMLEILPIADPANKRFYLAGLGLYLPMSTDTADLTYRITDVSGGSTTDLVFMSKHNQAAIQPKMPDECFDLVRVEIGAQQQQPRDNESTQEPFRLNDGRMVYLYLPETNEKCQNLPMTSKQIEPSVRQLQSY